jgi:hypothetical protein
MSDLHPSPEPPVEGKATVIGPDRWMACGCHYVCEECGALRSVKTPFGQGCTGCESGFQ